MVANDTIPQEVWEEARRRFREEDYGSGDMAYAFAEGYRLALKTHSLTITRTDGLPNSITLMRRRKRIVKR
jgi:hypothetical protein